MNSRRLLALLCSIALLASVVLAAPKARADDGDGKAAKKAAPAKPPAPKRKGHAKGKYLAKLKPAELAFLRKRMAGWDGLDVRSKDRIARQVIRLRDLSPEQSKRLGERLKKLGGPGRSSMFRFSQAVGERVWGKLPEAFRKEAEVRAVRSSLVKMVLFHKILSGVGRMEGGKFTSEDLAAFPKGWRSKAADLVAILEDENADKSKKRRARERLGGMRAYMLWGGLRRKLADANPDREIKPAEVVDAAEARWPEVFAAVVKDVSAKPESFYKSIEQRGRRSRGRSPFGGSERGKLSKSEAAWTVLSLERLAGRNWEGRPGLQAQADAVIRRMLIDVLGQDEAAVAKLPAFDQREARRKMLMRLLGKHLRGRDGRGEDARKRGGRGGPPGGGRWPGGGERGPRRGAAPGQGRPGDGAPDDEK